MSPAKPADKSYEELTQVLKQHLVPKPIIIAERLKFRKRIQKPGENIATYLAFLKQLAETCDFKAFLDEALRDQLVCGLRSEAIQKRLLTEAELDLKKALEISQAMEAATKQTMELQGATPVDSANYVRSGTHKATARQTKKPCYRCGGKHSPNDCRFKDQQCNKCNKTGHIAKMCHSSNNTRVTKKVQYVDNATPVDTHNSSDDDICLLNINSMSTDHKIIIHPLLNGKQVPMEVDTGATKTVMSVNTWRSLGKPKLNSCDLILKTYSGEILKVKGMATIDVQFNQQTASLPVVVLAGNGPTLFGRNWLKHIRLNWSEICHIGLGVEEVIAKYQNIFSAQTGSLKGLQATLKINPDATPKFLKPRSVPYALKPAIENDLQRLENAGIIKHVTYSDWATPIVPVPKADGTVRLCGDYKVTINQNLRIDQYPMPKAEDIFSTLNGGKKFTKLDLSQAYLQLPLDEQSQKLTTINTHKGLFQYTRLPYGIASAPAIFQMTMDKILQGLNGVSCYLDDILITGRDDTEHLTNLKKVLERLEEYGVQLKKSKCSFMCTSVEYLGYKIDAKGLHTTPQKVEAIQQAPHPENIQQLRSFLGLVHYYGKFIPNLATVTEPLNQLLHKGTQWQWSSDCEKAFAQLKNTLSSSPVLVHYDTNSPLRLACDASAYGVGAVISHTMPDGSEKPVAFASRTLTKAERNYSQLEKEALSIIFGIRKFHPYLYGRQFTLVTDHKPLVTILHPRKGTPPLAAARLQRWALILASYNYEIEFKPTEKHCNADSMSRLPLPISTEKEEELSEVSLYSLQLVETLPVTANHICKMTRNDPILSKVFQYTMSGWPSIPDQQLMPYYRRKYELSVECGCLLWGSRVIIPPKLQKYVLDELHVSHPGIVRMKSLARKHIWWPNVDRDLEEMVQDCQACQANRQKPPTAPLHPWSWPTGVWQRIHIDFAGPFLGHMFLLVIDSHSKWLEVFVMSSTTSIKTIDTLKSLFARYGLPEQIVSDNGPQFTSDEFKSFCKSNGIRHITGAPYHPSTNGAIERAVQTMKKSLKSTVNEQGTIYTKLSRFLMSYRSIPHSTTGETPADLFLRRPLRTRLDLLKPKLTDKVSQRQETQKRFHDGAGTKEREFTEGQYVLVENLRGTTPKWISGKIVEKMGPVSYKVEIDGVMHRRHIDQLLPAKRNFSISDEYQNDDDGVFIPTPKIPTIPEPRDNPVLRRNPPRHRRPPDRLVLT